MSKPLIITLIAVTFNLGGMLVIYSFMAFFLARLYWHDRGVLAVLMTIIIANVFWIVPTMIGFDPTSETVVSYPLFFGNWLVSAFSITLFCPTVKSIPRQLEDSARLDGCGWFGIYWHVVLPLVRRNLGSIALLAIMATTPPFLTDLIRSGGIYCFPSLRLSIYDAIPEMLALSATTSLPVIAIFFVAKHHLRHD